MLSEVVPEWCAIVPPGGVAVGEGPIPERSSDGELHASRPKDVLRLNTRIHFGEVRQMIVFMSGGAPAGGSAEHPASKLPRAFG